MLGDAGAHALGAALGAAIAVANGRTGLVLHAAALVATDRGGRPDLRRASGCGRRPGYGTLTPGGGLAHPYG